MLKLHNTLTRQKQDFKPLSNKYVGIYSCGPTVYDFAHIGNLRTYIFTDVLRRALLYNGYKVKQVMNITDVGHLTEDLRAEDKIEARARREKKSAYEIARFYEKVFLKDLKKLNILTPNKLPRASDYIKDQIKLVQALEKKGYTYRTLDGIYFDASKLLDYGKLTGQRLEEKQAGARVDVGEKKHPADFALWKFSPKGIKREMEWSSPWGKGFPGWHIECSAMSVKFLGQPFDVHTGGIDHIGTHHTNEIAQTEAATGKPLARFWLHGEFLTIEGQRMGKSEGNLITLAELKKQGFNPLAFRYLILSAHYRSPLNFTWKSLGGAQNALDNIYDKIQNWEGARIGCAEYEENFLAAINDDLNAPQALAIAHQLINDEKYPTHARAKTLLKFDKILGLNIIKYLGKKPKFKIPQAVKKLTDQREMARKQKNWARADELRKKINQAGFSIEDTDNGSRLKIDT